MSVFKRGQSLRAHSPSSAHNVSRETRKLEDDASCLEDIGFSHGLLMHLRLRAAGLEISPAQLLLAEGHIAPDEFYRAYASHIGARFTLAPAPCEKRLNWAAALRLGSARLADGSWLMAPQGHALSALQKRLSRRPRHDLIITTPTAFSQAIETQFSTRLADHAANHLSQSHPTYSAREGLGTGQKKILATITALFCFGLIDGGLIWTFCCAIFSTAIAFGVGIRLAALFMSLRQATQNAPPLSDSRLPFYSVLVPLYREANIIDDLLHHLSALDYPVTRHEILLILEEDDEETRIKVQKAPLPSHMRILIAPTGLPRTKPRALNIGLIHARGDLIAIFDAEDRPDPDQLRKAAASFADSPENIACLQASLAIENVRDSWFTRFFAIDYASHFDVLLLGWSRLHLPMPLGGTSNHFRAQALRKAGGWDAWNVTEDADLGLRLARLGYEARMLASTTWEEAPRDLANWLPQRRRWMKGWMQTCLTHTRRPFHLWHELGFLRATHILALLIANTFGPLVGIWVTVYVLGLMLEGDFLSSHEWPTIIANLCWTGLAISGFLSLLLPTILGVARRRLWTSLVWMVLRPLHWAFMSLASIQAVYELLHRPFYWAKTRHGLSKFSKARDPDPA